MVYHRPLSSIYADNYRYRNFLYYYYYPIMDDVEKRYRNTLSRTPVRSDRGDLGMYSFAGSHIHGGRQPADRGMLPTRGTTRPTYGTYDLYAPLGRDYGRKYRDLSPEPRLKPKADYLYPDDYSYYRTTPTRIPSDYDRDLKKTIKTTTTTEHWVPLTTYIYNTPYHSYYYRSSPYASYTYRTGDDLYSYNYVDDFKRSYTTTSSRSKNIDALDLSISKSIDKSEYEHFSKKCHEVQSQLDEVKSMVSDAESRIKSEVLTNRNKMQTDLADIAMIIDDAARYNEDLHRIIKKQAKHLNEMNSLFDDTNRHLGDVSDVLEKSRTRCTSLQSEISSVQTSLDMAMKRRIVVV